MEIFSANARIQQCVVACSAMMVSMQAWSGVTGPLHDKASAARASSSVVNKARGRTPHVPPSQNAHVKVYGQTYGEWAADWVRWAVAGPAGQNAIEDTTGRYCNLNQPRHGVWFLAGTFADVGPVNRACTIPKGRALFYPIFEWAWTDCPGTPDVDLSDAEVRAILAALTDLACELTSTLDGVAISGLQVLNVRTQSPKFSSYLPSNSVLKDSCVPPLEAGRTGRQFTDGYWVMLPPLSPGKHKLTLHGASCGDLVYKIGPVTYDLTVHSR